MSASPAPLSPRSMRRVRQKSNTTQQRRSLAHDALLALRETPTFGNAFRAWLANADEAMSPQDFKSASKFVRSLRTLSSKSSGEPDYPETARISADMLVQWVDDLAWSLNVKFTLKENAANLRTPTSRIGVNFRSLINFLVRACLFSQHDFTYLLDSCRSLEEDLNRTARVNRIMELYVVYIQEAYFDTGRTVDESYWGEYEVERVSGRRTIVLRNYDADESGAGSSSTRTFQVHFPSPLVNVVKRGDTMTLQICHLEQGCVWVPYMYSGFTPTRDDGGAATPTERQTRSPRRYSDDAEALQASLARMDISSPRSSVSRSWRNRSRTPQRRHSSATQPHNRTPQFDFNFDESRFTDAYFRAWEGDIDTDEDVGELVSAPGAEGSVRGASSSGVNLYYALKERHS